MIRLPGDASDLTSGHFVIVFAGSEGNDVHKATEQKVYDILTSSTVSASIFLLVCGRPVCCPLINKQKRKSLFYGIADYGTVLKDLRKFDSLGSGQHAVDIKNVLVLCEDRFSYSWLFTTSIINTVTAAQVIIN